VRRSAQIAFSLILSLVIAGCATVDPDAPRLPRKIGTDLFADGIARVELAHATDGDTAAFIINGDVYDTRFLAVNTPETSHPTYGAEPWGRAAKEYTAQVLTNADEIILELDPNSDLYDTYDRLLAWVWVDGELLNYRLVKESYAWVMYLYGDFKYNGLMIRTESETRRDKKRIHGESDPDYDYEKQLIDHTIESVRSESIGSRVHVDGVVTAKIGNNGYIQSGGYGIYLYTQNKRWRFLQPGNHIDVIGMVSDYNGLLEITNIESVELLQEGVPVPEPLNVRLEEVGEDLEARLVYVGRVEIMEVEPHTGKGYNVLVRDREARGIIRIDKYLIPYIEPEVFRKGAVVSLTATVGQYVDDYQLMLARIEHLVPVDK
jgi:micrococcal nuclease